MLSRSLKQCPNDGELWSLAIELEPKATRKKKIVDALKSVPDDPYVNMAVAKLFWSERNKEKARKWAEKAVLLEPKLVDAWALLYLFTKAKEVFDKCIEQAPNKGRIFKIVKKTDDGWKLTFLQIIETIAQ